MTSEYITLEEIIVIYGTIQKKYGLPLGHVKMGELETLIARCDGVPFSKDRPDVLRRAAILLEGIIRLHIFVDGNKRTALTVTQVFLNRNDYAMIIPWSSSNFACEIAEDWKSNTEKSLNKIICWLDRHSAQITQKDKIRRLIRHHITLPKHLLYFVIKTRLETPAMWFFTKYWIKDVDDAHFILDILDKQADFFNQKMGADRKKKKGGGVP